MILFVLVVILTTVLASCTYTLFVLLARSLARPQQTPLLLDGAVVAVELHVLRWLQLGRRCFLGVTCACSGWGEMAHREMNDTL